jgi:DNA-binding transcriptional LysR family regulator
MKLSPLIIGCMNSISDFGLFVRVVSNGSLSAAARELGVSTAAVSKRLIHLEQSLGAQLLTRTTRNLSTTRAGAAYFERCVAILSEIEEAEAEVGMLGAAANGVLKVIAPIDFGRSHIAPHVPEFISCYPQIRLDLRLTTQPVDLVADQCDLWIHIGEVEDSRFVVCQLASGRHVVCAAPKYLERYGEPQTPADLKHHNCLTLELPNANGLWHFVGPNGAIHVRVSGNVRSNDGDIITRCAQAGVGIAMKAVRDVDALLQSGELTPILKEYAIPPANIYAVYLPSRHRPGKVRAFIKFLTTTYRVGASRGSIEEDVAMKKCNGASPAHREQTVCATG